MRGTPVNRTPVRRACLASTAILALGLTACGASNETSTSSSDPSSDGGSSLSGTLSGAGSSAQEAAMGAWTAGFQEANPDVTVNYDAVGSGDGRKQFESGAVPFAGSDDPLPKEEAAAAEKTCGGDVVQLPVYVSPIAVVYNLPEVEDLQLSPETLGAIFAGDITTWDDDAIAADNPDASLPSTEITPVHRSDDSGTTGNFTDYLDSAASSWTEGATETWPIEGGEGADGTSGVVASVTNGEGTIGYADASQAGDLGIATVKVGEEYVAPTPEGAAAALDDSDVVTGGSDTELVVEVNRSTSAQGAYPILLVSYHMMCATQADQETADLLTAFEEYVLSSEGQDTAAKNAGSAPIPDSLRSKAEEALGTVSTS